LNEYLKWQYDVGDDPSFYCAKTYENNLTWGICRRNIRNKIEKKDVVIFFCYSSVTNAYYLAGIATVINKIKQTQIWKENRYKRYRKYFNILIRFHKNKWEHFEPLFNEKGAHKDWVHRLSNNSQSNLEISHDSFFSEIKVADNYVIFERNNNETYILNSPIHVANWDCGKDNEDWIINRDINKIKEAIFKSTGRKSLRVHQRNQAHVHIRIKMDKNDLKKWTSYFISVIKTIDSSHHDK
jgi:hypothetical protein